MSHFTKLNLEIKNIEALNLAATKMGLKVKENTIARGWSGITTKADYVIVGDKNYDIAVKKTSQGHYELVADWSMMNKSMLKIVGEKGGLLIQNYGVACVAELAKEQNMETEFELIEDGTIRLILTEKEDEYVQQY